jgi:hypothetical protein
MVIVLEEIASIVSVVVLSVAHQITLIVKVSYFMNLCNSS